MTGGKLTTYRAMAEETVDTALRLAGIEAPSSPTALRLAGIEAPSSPTARLPLLGAADRVTLRQLRFARRLVERYGTEASRVAQTEATDSLDPLVDGLQVLRAEAVFAFRDEGALTAEDVVDRRLRLGAVPAERELAIAAVQDLAESLDLPLVSAPETAAGETSSSALMRQRERATVVSGPGADPDRERASLLSG